MQSTATLSILHVNDQYIFHFDCPTESSMLPGERVHAPFGVLASTTVTSQLRLRLKEDSEAAAEVLRHQYASSRSSMSANTSLRNLGHLLFDLVLPADIQQALVDLPEQMPLLLKTDDLSLPWELLHDGQQWLALKRPVGRSLLSSNSPRYPAQRRQRGLPVHTGRQLLVISNPTGDLPEADKEAQWLFDNAELGLMSPRLLCRQHASKHTILKELASGQYAIIHYSGHAKAGALMLADGELTAAEIQKVLRGRPFIFLNACSSGRGEELKDGANLLPLAGSTVQSLATAFILGGGSGFIGTLWPIFDVSSREFAEWFYTLVLMNGVSVGEALRQARQRMYDVRSSDPLWASFMLYGDPMLNIAVTPPERRYVTVLVARIEGLFSLFERQDLEEASEIRQQAIGQLRLIAERYDGQFHAPLSQLLNVHFGVPIAHGTDAEHAIYAALGMIRTLRTFNEQWGTRLSVPLGLCIGISTGQVLARRQTTAAGTDYQIDGQVEGLAAQLATQAGQDQILVEQATYQLVRDEFTFEGLDLSTMTHGTTPRVAYRVVEAKSDSPTVRVTVGRDEKLAQLRRWIGETASGQGRVVGIVGAAGVGKTCLVQTFQDEMEGQSHRWLNAYCYRYAQTESYALLAQVIRALAGARKDDDKLTQRRKLEQLVLETIPGQPSEALLNEGLALLGRVVGLSFPAASVDNLGPALQHKRLIRMFEAVLGSQATSQPIVLVLDDLQWVDQASLNVLNQIVTSVRRMPLLLLVVYRRAEWSHNWSDDTHYRNLPLDDLSFEAQRALLAHLLGMAVPPERLAQAILKQTGGNPFFIKEYVWLLQQEGFLVRSGDRWLQARDIAEIPLLNRVERLVQERLDRLPDSSRQVIQSAAVIGEKFEDELLVAVPKKVAREQLDHDLGELTKQSLIYEVGGWPIFFYTFSHGLIHQTIYRLLSERFRRTLHRLVAQALSRLYHNQEQMVYRLAHHYYYSNDLVNAIDYCLQAAKEDADKWANQGAIDWYGRALEKIQSLDEETPTETEQAKETMPAQIVQWQVEALEGQAEVRSFIGMADEAIAGYEHALALVVASDVFPVTYLAELYHKIAIVHHDKGQYALAQQAVDQGLQALAGLTCLEAGRLHVYAGVILWKLGRFADGLASCEEGIAMIEKSEGTEGIRDLAQGYNLRGIFYRRMKDSLKAIMSYERSIALYEQAEYIPGLERASYNLACVHKDLGKWEAALASFKQSSTLSERTGEVQRQAAALNGQGEIYLRQGKLDQAIQAYSKARQIVEELGIGEFVGIALMNLGASYLKKGELSFARDYLEKSLHIFQRLKANGHLPEVWRHLATLELLSGQSAKGQQLAQEAYEWALKLQHRQEEGQAKRSLGHAYRALGQLEKASVYLEESLTILEERHIPVEIGLTLIELARLRQAQLDASSHRDALREQAIAYCDRAITIFDELGAALDLKRAQEIRSSL